MISIGNVNLFFVVYFVYFIKMFKKNILPLLLYI